MLTVNNQTYSLKNWAIKLQVPNYCFRRLAIKYNNKKMEAIIENIINNDLIDLKNKIITVNDISLNLFAWAKKLRLSKYSLFFYTYENNITATQQYISGLINNIIDFKPHGKILTINNISNTYIKWSIFAGKSISYVNSLINVKGEQETIEILKVLLNSPINCEESLDINNIKRSYSEWSLFCNKSVSYVYDIIKKYGTIYAKKHIIDLLSTDHFLNKTMLITINNQTASLYKWARLINTSSCVLYNIRNINGLDAVIKYIKQKYNYEYNYITVNKMKKTLIEWSIHFGKSNEYFNNILKKYDLITVKTIIKYMLMAENCNNENIITVNNNTKNINEWNSYFNFDNNILQNYLIENGKEKTIQYICKLLKKKEKCIEINNIYKTYAEWAEYLGYSKGYFHSLTYNYGSDYTINRLHKLYDVYSSIKEIDYFSLPLIDKKAWQKKLYYKTM